MSLFDLRVCGLARSVGTRAEREGGRKEKKLFLAGE